MRRLPGMKQHTLNRFPLVAICVATACALFSLQPACAQTGSYVASEIQGATVAFRVNNLGDIVGKAADPATGEGRAATWNHGGMRRLILGKLAGGDYSFASGINDVGQIAGASNVPGWVVPFLWNRGNGLRRIPLLPGDTCGQAFAINRNGHVTGYSSGPNGKRAFLWRRGNDVRNLGVLPGGDHSSAADVNDADDVVGTSGTPTGDHAVLWTSAGDRVDLGTLPGDTASEATAINNNGVVVGYSKGFQGTHAFLWTQDDGMQGLGALPNGSSSRAFAINDSDIVVGTSTSALGDRAIVWTREAGIRDLNAQASLPFGVMLLEAHAINNRGQILVLGMNTHEHGTNEDPPTCAPTPPLSFLLTPQ
jgi:probable HAF family extracellular repeat protein